MRLSPQKFLFLLLFIGLCIPSAQAKHRNRPDLAASLIPNSLENNFAHAVLRFDSSSLKVISKDEVLFTYTYAYTILREDGSDYGDLRLPYNNLIDILSISGNYYDAQGKLIKQMSNNDILDISAAAKDFAFNSDGKLKYYHYVSTAYPYTAVFEIKSIIKNTLFLPLWQPQSEPDVSVEQSAFEINYPDSVPIKTKAYQMPVKIEPVKTSSEGRTTLKWDIGMLPAFEYQPLSQAGNYISPTVITASTNFDLMGHPGKLDNWKDFGKFYFELNKNRDSLSPEMTAKVKMLTKNDTSVFQKVRTLYQYMQQNTRYVLNVYGIAAWQTAPAKEVCSKGFGDCKGLTNYLKALLKAADVPSCMTLVSAGTDRDYSKIDPGFPYNYFNHVILCVPNRKDSIWVECTSPVSQAGYLGDFTDNRYALVCDSSGGTLTKTPSYDLEKNYIKRKATIHFQPSSSSQDITLNNYYCGPVRDGLFLFLKTSSKDEIQKAINTKFDFQSYQVKDFHFDFTGSQLLPAIKEDAHISATGIVNHTGNRYFIKMNWFSNPLTEIVQTSPRTQPIVLDKSFAISDSVILEIPNDYRVEHLPQEVRLAYPFANFSCSYSQKKNKIILFRKFQQHKGNYPASAFQDYQQLYQVLNQQMAVSNIVLIYSSDTHESTSTNPK